MIFDLFAFAACITISPAITNASLLANNTSLPAEEKHGRYILMANIKGNYVIYEVERSGDGFTIKRDAFNDIMSDEDIIAIIRMYIAS